MKELFVDGLSLHAVRNRGHLNPPRDTSKISNSSQSGLLSKANDLNAGTFDPHTSLVSCSWLNSDDLQSSRLKLPRSQDLGNEIGSDDDNNNDDSDSVE